MLPLPLLLLLLLLPVGVRVRGQLELGGGRWVVGAYLLLPRPLSSQGAGPNTLDEARPTALSPAVAAVDQETNRTLLMLGFGGEGGYIPSRVGQHLGKKICRKHYNTN